jgi:hypothetical protein
MNLRRLIRGRRWLGLLIIAAAFVCLTNRAVIQFYRVHDRSVVAQMMAKKKTVCVGRYLVDVPAQAEVSFSGAIINGFSVATFEETDTEFRKRVAAREAEIKAHGPATNGSGGMVEAQDLDIPGITGRTLIYGHNRGYWFENGRRIDDEWLAVQIHARTDGLSVSLSAKTADQASIASAQALLSRLQVRGNDGVPAAQGFCISRAVFVDPLPVHKSEQLLMQLRLPGHSDFGFTLASIAGGTPETSLLTRVAKAEAGTSAIVLLRMNKLREGKRSINGIEGEEVLVRVREFDFTNTYGFSWDASGANGDLLRPYLSLELQTGMSDLPGRKTIDTSLHEDALLTLWDSIASSIRLRGQELQRSVPASDAARSTTVAATDPNRS